MLATPVGLVVGFGRDEPNQLVQFLIGGCEDGAVAVGAHAEHQPSTVDIQQPQLAQRRGQLVGDDDLGDGAGQGELPAAQVIRRVLPVADDPLVADATPPLDLGAAWLGRNTVIRPGFDPGAAWG